MKLKKTNTVCKKITAGDNVYVLLSSDSIIIYKVQVKKVCKDGIISVDNVYISNKNIHCDLEQMLRKVKFKIKHIEYKNFKQTIMQKN